MFFWSKSKQNRNSVFSYRIPLDGSILLKIAFTINISTIFCTCLF